MSSGARLAAVAVALVVVSTAAVLTVRQADPESILASAPSPGRAADDRTVNVATSADVALADLGTIPALDTSLGWLNAPATGPVLDARVVAYQLWTFGCFNCTNTLPFMRALAERYEADGLVVVGIHTPEFDHERDHGNVATAVEDLGVTWPVLFDDDKVNWRRFGNRFWPRLFVADVDGIIRRDRVGEGGYAETEDVVRSLLGVDPSSPRSSYEGEA